jgi:hypothetical protein
MRYYIAVDSAIYAACILLNAVSVWSLLNQRTGHFAMQIMYPVLLLVLIAVHTCKVGADEQLDVKSIVGDKSIVGIEY